MKSVIPAKAGIYNFRLKTVDPRLRGDDVYPIYVYFEQILITFFLWYFSNILISLQNPSIAPFSESMYF